MAVEARRHLETTQLASMDAKMWLYAYDSQLICTTDREQLISMAVELVETSRGGALSCNMHAYVSCE